MPGVVYPNVDALVVVQGEADHSVDFFAVANVAGQSQGSIGMTDTRASSFGAAGVAGKHHDGRALIGKNLGDGFADSHRSACHHYNFSGQIILAWIHASSFPPATSKQSRAYNLELPGVFRRKTPGVSFVSLLPLFPLDLVLFPGTSLPLHIFEPRYKEMISECLDRKKSFGIVRAKEEGVAEIGCTAEIITVAKKYPDGRMDIVTQGRERFEVMQVNQERSFLQAEVLYLPDEPGQASPEEIAQAVKLQG